MICFGERHSFRCELGVGGLPLGKLLRDARRMSATLSARTATSITTTTTRFGRVGPVVFFQVPRRKISVLGGLHNQVWAEAQAISPDPCNQS